MTTRSQFDAILSKFKGITPRDAYKQLCEERELPYQLSLYKRLPNELPGWERLHVLLLDDCLLGAKGAMPLLPIILVSTNLRQLSLRDCGLTDAFMLELCSILMDHPGLRSVDVRENPLITVFCATPVLAVLRTNTNLTDFRLEGTHLGRNITAIAAKLVRHNYQLVSNYYTDSFFKLKNIFGYLDVDGTGWVNLPALVMSCPYPALQEQLIARIVKKQPKQRSDNSISVNAFMDLVYLNYKTEREILEYANQEVDTHYLFMVANWKQLLAGEERWNRKRSEARHRHGNEEVDLLTTNAAEYCAAAFIALPESLHRVRVKERLLSNDEVELLFHSAMELQVQEVKTRKERAKAKAMMMARAKKEESAGHPSHPMETTAAAGSAGTCREKKPSPRGEEYNNVGEDEDFSASPDENGPTSSCCSSSNSMLTSEGEEAAGVTIGDGSPSQDYPEVCPSIANFLKAVRSLRLHEAPVGNQASCCASPRRRTHFYNDDFQRATDAPSSLNMNALLRMQAQQEENEIEKGMSDTSSEDVNDSGETVTDPEDPAHHWQLPSTLVQLLAEFFFETFDRLPKQRQTTTPATPKAQRDRSMRRPSIPTEIFLSGVFETDFEILRPSLIAHQFKAASLPIEDTTLTLPEMVNMMDELYLQASTDKVISNEILRGMPNPFGDPVYAEVLANYVFRQEYS